MSDYLENEQYTRNSKQCGLKSGARVTVIRKASNHELGWQNSWPPEMDKYVGKTFTIVDVNHSNGINFKEDNQRYRFPYYVLVNAETFETIIKLKCVPNNEKEESKAFYSVRNFILRNDIPMEKRCLALKHLRKEFLGYESEVTDNDVQEFTKINLEYYKGGDIFNLDPSRI